MPNSEPDCWARWIAKARHSNDPDTQKAKWDYLHSVRDKVLDGASIHPGDVVLDVGAGDGLVGFGALGRLDSSGKVIFSDVSADLLDVCRRLSAELGRLSQSEFVQAAAEDLSPIGACSVDVVTTRAVLIYVENKQKAMREFFRVLRPGGRVSIFEPINRIARLRSEGRNDFYGLDTAPVRALLEKIRAGSGAKRVPIESDPMLNFDDRDLVRYAEEAGFEDIDLTLTITLRELKVTWEDFYCIPPNPKSRSIAEVVAKSLAPDEVARLVGYLRPLVESGKCKECVSLAHLRARKRQ